MSLFRNGRTKHWSVYVVTAPSSGVVYHKVGVTCDLAQRIKSIQTGCPIRLQDAALLPIGVQIKALDIECSMHDALRKIHSHGEWFVSNNADDEALVRSAMEDAVGATGNTAWSRLTIAQVIEIARADAHDTAVKRSNAKREMHERSRRLSRSVRP